MEAARELASLVGVSGACRALVLPRATYYRRLAVVPAPDDRDTPTEASRGDQNAVGQADPNLARRSPRALNEAEQQKVLAVLHSERFVDRSPGQVYATLLDEGSYLCSERTMYRVLEMHQEVKERRNQRKHPEYTKPELLATAPNEVWSWDITKLRGPVKWTYFYLYVILDIFSRYVVGWMVATKECAELAKQLIEETCTKQGIGPGELTLHADRGSPMKAKTTALLLADLGVAQSHGRPHVSDDNPFSESQFKTLKYNAQFPERFGSLMDARAFCGPFFLGYNTEFRHSGIAMMTPEMVHYGLTEAVRAKRQCVLAEAYAAHPERFVRGKPMPADVPNAVWINPPPKDHQTPQERSADNTGEQEDLA